MEGNRGIYGRRGVLKIRIAVTRPPPFNRLPAPTRGYRLEGSANRLGVILVLLMIPISTPGGK